MGPLVPTVTMLGLGVLRGHLRQGLFHQTPPPGLGGGHRWKVSLGVFARGPIARSKGCPSRLGLEQRRSGFRWFTNISCVVSTHRAHASCAHEGFSSGHTGICVISETRSVSSEPRAWLGIGGSSFGTDASACTGVCLPCGSPALRAEGAFLLP